MKTTYRFDRQRRIFLQRGAAAVVGPLLISERTIAQTRTLYVNSWGGSYTAAQDAAFFKPFTAATGIQIRPVTPVSYGKVKAQVQSGRYEFDTTSVASTQFLRGVREGLFEPIDWSVVHKDKVPADAVIGDGYGIASNILGTALAYRTDKFPNGLKSWADFWDVKKFPGPRSLCSHDPTRSLIYALQADGVPREKVYPIDLDRGFRKLEEIKPHIKVWWREGNQSQQLIRDGEVDAMSMWNARATELKQQGVPVELVWEGAMRSTSTWGVLKGSPNRTIAWEFIAFTCGAVPQAEFGKRLYYGPINPDAFAHIPPEIAKQLPTYPANKAVSVTTDDRWEAEHIAEIEQRFAQWVSS
jgi:putative spermidine/putrescine transport system substrate-binding protein